MKTPAILDGITFAIIISLGAALASLLLGGLLIYAVLFELLMYAATLAYLLYLLRRSQARIGRVVVIAGWAEHNGEEPGNDQHQSSFHSAHRVALDAVRKLSQS
jgi:uncharacterized protein (DUF58 family)